MNQFQKLVCDFMAMAGQNMPKAPTDIHWSISGGRRDMISEELEEYQSARLEHDLVAMADAIGDMLYVVVGTACAHGNDIEPVFNEIHRSNLTKLWTAKEVTENEGKIKDNGWNFELAVWGDLKPSSRIYRVKNASGKLIKSPSYSPANLAPIIDAQMKGGAM
jgi:predicted HAD superfamily Cof-like phosphohydrolase